jgi:hypothetical protein
MAEKTDYELTEAEAAVLTAATQDAAAAAGALGGSIGGAIGAGGAGRAGGGKGGAAGGRFTKAQTAETSVEVPHDPETARERARESITASGAVVEDPNAAGDGSVSGLVGSGALNMAPAMVRVGIDTASSGSSRAHVRATGKEALIKQRIGAKAADRIAAALAAV